MITQGPQRLHVRVIPPETDETKALAKSVNETERAEAIARILAHFCEIHDLDSEPEHIRKHFAKWGFIATRGSRLGSDQFRWARLAGHAAAQAAHDGDAVEEHYIALDLLGEHNSLERFHWTRIICQGIEAYLNVLGGVTTHAAKTLYEGRLRLVKGDNHGAH